MIDVVRLVACLSYAVNESKLMIVGSCTFHRRVGKGKNLNTCYSATYMSQTRDQQRFTVSEVAADWQRIMPPSIGIRLDPRCSWQTHHLLLVKFVKHNQKLLPKT